MWLSATKIEDNTTGRLKIRAAKLTSSIFFFLHLSSFISFFFNFSPFHPYYATLLSFLMMEKMKRAASKQMPIKVPQTI